MPKFSILTASHNNLHFLGQYFDSILSQQYTNLEIIFVDDCSTDGSFEFAKAIQDPRLRVESTGNHLYCSGSYAKALSLATGEYCGIVDADDTLALGAIERIVDVYLKHPEIEFIYTQHYWCNEKLKIIKDGVSAWPHRSFLLSAERGKQTFSHWRTFKRVLAERGEIFPQGLKFAVDRYMGFMLEELGDGAFWPESLYYYRTHKHNMSHSHATKQYFALREMYQQFRQKRSQQGISAHRVQYLLDK